VRRTSTAERTPSDHETRPADTDRDEHVPRVFRRQRSVLSPFLHEPLSKPSVVGRPDVPRSTVDRTLESRTAPALVRHASGAFAAERQSTIDWS
jgi:hypothetical protein